MYTMKQKLLSAWKIILKIQMEDKSHKNCEFLVRDE